VRIGTVRGLAALSSGAPLTLSVLCVLQVQVLRDVYQEYIDTCHDFYDIYPEERMRDVSR
jgi:hypothetical protein